MALVRLASRAVVGLFDRADAVGRVLDGLARMGIRPAEVSILAKPETLPGTGGPAAGPGPLRALGKRSGWLVETREIERGDFGPLVGAGALAAALGDSPSTSVVGALVMQGIPRREAVVYADFLSGGKILLLVGVADQTQGERVRTLLESGGAETAAYFAGRPYGTAFHGTGPGLS